MAKAENAPEIVSSSWLAKMSRQRYVMTMIGRYPADAPPVCVATSK